MTHKSSFCYGWRARRDAHSGAVSGEVRVSYFDPETGRPRKTKPKPRGKRNGGAPEALPGAYRFGRMPGNCVECEVDGVRYPSIAAAAQATGLGYSALQNARRCGRSEVKGRAVAFRKGAA